MCGCHVLSAPGDSSLIPSFFFFLQKDVSLEQTFDIWNRELLAVSDTDSICGITGHRNLEDLCETERLSPRQSFLSLTLLSPTSQEPRIQNFSSVSALQKKPQMKPGSFYSQSYLCVYLTGNCGHNPTNIASMQRVVPVIING